MPFLDKEMLAARALVPEGAVCLDVGAAGGTWTWLLSRLAGPGGQVFGFEPRPGSQRVVSRLLRILRADNATVLPLALGSGPGHLSLALARMPTMSYVRPPTDSGWRPTEANTRVRDVIEVEVTTLDAFARDHDLPRVDFVKIDVEGHELEVLEGAAATIRGHRPVIVCEIEERHLERYGHTADDVFDRLEGAGYRLHRLERARLLTVTGWDPGEHNYLALPRDGRVRPGIWSATPAGRRSVSR